MLLPNILLIIGTLALVYLGIRRGLAPLTELSKEISQRAPHDLSPLPQRDVPAEAQPLVRAMDGLIDDLRSASAAQQAFLANAAHQLKTPLAGLRMQADLAQREDASADDLKQSLQQIGHASVRATHTVNQLLALARAEAGGAAMAQQRCDLAALTIETWQDDKLDQAKLQASRETGVARFKAALAEVMAQLDTMIPDGKNVLFAHTMAGGIPKAKVFLVIANRIYKGRGARHMSSQALIDSDLGRLILQNFDEVSANTFGHLIEASAAIRDRIGRTGGQVRYTAYGYHGTSVLIGDDYRWQTYTNYTQGYAKMRLERIAEEAVAKGIQATVFNCPEIRTNSSDVFAGIELSLLPLLAALRKEGGGAWVDALWSECEALLQEGTSLDQVLRMVTEYQQSAPMQPYYNFTDWPLPNSADQAEATVGTSTTITGLHRDPKQLVSDVLSHHVVTATGQLIFGVAGQAGPQPPVLWLNHDLVARVLIARAA